MVTSACKKPTFCTNGHDRRFDKRLELKILYFQPAAAGAAAAAAAAVSSGHANITLMTLREMVSEPHKTLTPLSNHSMVIMGA